MATTDVDVIRWGRERARTGPWRGSPQVALLTPLPGAPVPSLAFVRRCVETLSARGFSGVVTGALAPVEQRAFLAAGFAEAERLHLLSHNLRGLSSSRGPLADGRRAGVRLRRARPRDRDAVLMVDGASFPNFWQLDDIGLTDALTATTHSRFEVAVNDSGRVVGYAISGRSGRSGYLQRLAVDPGQQGRGLGRALVNDGLRWLARWRAEQCVVNTQWGNEAALGLYERIGFTRMPEALAVLSKGQSGHHAPAYPDQSGPTASGAGTDPEALAMPTVDPLTFARARWGAPPPTPVD